MGAEPERPTEHLTLARVHAVLGALSAAAIVQLAGVTPQTPALTLAILCFAISVLLNVTCYVLEVDKNIPAISPKFRALPVWLTLLVLSTLALNAPLVALGLLISNVLPGVGMLFATVGMVLQLGHTLVYGWQAGVLIRRESTVITECEAELDAIQAELGRTGGVGSESLVKRLEEVNRRTREAYERMRGSGILALFPKLMHVPPLGKR